MRFDKQQISQICKLLTAHLRDEDFPIDFEKILWNIDQRVTIFNSSFEDDNVSWIVKKVWSSYEIYYNRNQSPNRQKFTVAHELWHIVLWHMLNESKKVDMRMRANWWYTWKEHFEESEANNFASCLLMPANIVKKKIKDWLKSSQDLALFFWVSKQAMDIRLFNLWFDTLDD